MNRIDIKIEELERVQNAESEARGITKEAKYLCYPISEIAHFSRGISWRKIEEGENGVLVVSIPNIKKDIIS